MNDNTVTGSKKGTGLRLVRRKSETPELEPETTDKNT